MRLLYTLLAAILSLGYGKTQNVGGQAVLEGVMMRGPKKWSVVVRLPDGSISSKVTDYIPFSKRNKLVKLPFIRGIFTLFESLVLGYRALDYSAAVLEGCRKDSSDQIKDSSPVKDLEPTSKESIVKPPESMGALSLVFTIFLSILLAGLIFVAIPHLLALLLGRNFGFDEGNLVFHILDGLIKFGFFLSYIYLIGNIPEIRRVYSYHGAEHRAIYAYEAGLPLEPLYARHFPLWHPRCGTAFIFLLLGLSILLFALIFPLLNLYQGEGWLNRALSGSLIKLFLTLPLAGISYEISRQAGKPKSCGFWRIMIFPGLLIQRLTTRETDDQKLEVALRALSEALDILPQNAYLDPLTVSAFKDKACSTTTYN